MNFLDIFVLLLYISIIAAIGIYVSRGVKTTESYFIAERSIPAWVIGFTFLGTIISSGTVVGHPGTSYQKGLILLVPHFVLPFVLVIVAKYIVPFYRRVVRMSAYEYIGKRFGIGGRLYTSVGFLLDRIIDLGFTLLTTALAVSMLTHWDLRLVICCVGAFTISYTLIGGIRAVVWTDVVQGIVLMSGGIIVLARLLFAPEASAPFAVVSEAYRIGKLTTGSWELSWHMFFDSERTTEWIFLLAFFIQWTRRYVTDQHMVQRYLLARTDAEASKGATIGALFCLPVFTAFMFIGSCLAGFFNLTGFQPPQIADQVMPFFLANYLPSGLLGLLVAAVLASAVSTVSGDLNSVATVATTDHFATWFPNATDRTRLFFGRVMVVVGGSLAALAAVLLIPTNDSAPLLERGVTITAILSGGTLGLFMLGFLTRRGSRRGCYIGIAACVIFTSWALLTVSSKPIMDIGFNFPFNPVLIGLGSHLVLFCIGWLASVLMGGYRPENVCDLTVWAHHSEKTRENVK